MFETIDYYFFSATATKQLAQLQFLLAQAESAKSEELLNICKKIKAQKNQFFRRLKLDLNTLHSFEVIFQETEKNLKYTSEVYKLISQNEDSLKNWLAKDKVYRWSLRIKLASQGIFNAELIRPFDDSDKIPNIILWDNILVWYQLVSTNTDDLTLKEYKQKAISELINKSQNNGGYVQSFGIAQLHLFLKTLAENNLEIAIKIWNFMLDEPQLKIVIQDLLENISINSKAIPAVQLSHLMIKNPIFFQAIIEKIKLQNNDDELSDSDLENSINNWKLIHLEFIEPKNLAIFFKTCPQLLLNLLKHKIHSFIDEITNYEKNNFLPLIKLFADLVKGYEVHKEIIASVIKKNKMPSFISGMIQLLFLRSGDSTELFDYFLDSEEFTQELLTNFLNDIYNNQHLSFFLVRRLSKMPNWLHDDQRDKLYNHLNIVTFYQAIKYQHFQFKPSNFIFHLRNKSTADTDKEQILRELFTTKNNHPNYYLALTDSEWITLFRARDQEHHFNDQVLEDDDLDLDTMLTVYGEYHHLPIAWLDNIQRQASATSISQKITPLLPSTAKIIHNFDLPSASNQNKFSKASDDSLKKKSSKAKITKSALQSTGKVEATCSEQVLNPTDVWEPKTRLFIQLEPVISNCKANHLHQLLQHNNMADIPTYHDLEIQIQLALQDLIHRISLEFKEDYVLTTSTREDGSENNIMANNQFAEKLVNAIVLNEAGKRYLLEQYPIDSLEVSGKFHSTMKKLNSENMKLSSDDIVNIKAAIHKIFLQWRKKRTELTLIAPLLQIILANLSKIELKMIVQNTYHQYGKSQYSKLLNKIIEQNTDKNDPTNSHLLKLLLRSSNDYHLSRQELLGFIDLPILRNLLSMPEYLKQSKMQQALVECGLINEAQLYWTHAAVSEAENKPVSKKKNVSIIDIDQNKLIEYDTLLDSALQILENLKFNTADSPEFQAVLRICERSIDYQKPYSALLQDTHQNRFSITIPSKNHDNEPIVLHAPQRPTNQPELPSPQYPGRPSICGMPSPSIPFTSNPSLNDPQCTAVQPELPSPQYPGRPSICGMPSPSIFFLNNPTNILGAPSPFLGKPSADPFLRESSIRGMPSPFPHNTSLAGAPSPNPLYPGRQTTVENSNLVYSSVIGIPSPQEQLRLQGELAAMPSPHGNLANLNLQTHRTSDQEVLKTYENMQTDILSNPLSLIQCLALLKEYQINQAEINTELENLQFKIQEIIQYQTSLLEESLTPKFPIFSA